MLLIFSYFYFFFCAPAFRIVFSLDTEPRLALSGSTPAILRRRFQKRQAESSARGATEPAIFIKKGNRIVTSAVRGRALSCDNHHFN
jgi:hypothetical protein